MKDGGIGHQFIFFVCFVLLVPSQNKKMWKNICKSTLSEKHNVECMPVIIFHK